jgi:hypothetical protein
MENKTVTAQDFMDATFPVSMSKEKFEALLSSARQEARREALKEMDEAHGGCSIQKGRWGEVGKLRAEYLNQP